jgi:hypothetical protein
MQKWMATITIEEKDNYNNTWPEMKFQVVVEANTYGQASKEVDKYVLDHFIRKIGPIQKMK